MKKLFCTLSIILVMALLLAACGGNDTSGEGEGAATEPVVFKIAQSLTEKDPVQKGFEKFGELLEERTEGRYKVEIFANGVLGTDMEITEAVEMGNIDIISCHGTNMSNFSSIWYVFDLPFAFPTEELYDKVVRGDLRQELVDATEADMNNNVVLLDMWERGYRCLTCNKPVKTAADMQGVRMRVMENALHQGYWAMVGADPATLPWADVYVALQQKAMDSHDNAPSLIASANLNEVQDYLMLSNHILSSSSILMNADKFNAMSPEDQEIVRECMIEAGIYQDTLLREAVASDVATLKERGMTVLDTNEFDLDSFVEIANEFTASLGEEYAAAVGFFEKVKALE